MRLCLRGSRKRRLKSFCYLSVNRRGYLSQLLMFKERFLLWLMYSKVSGFQRKNKRRKSIHSLLIFRYSQYEEMCIDKCWKYIATDKGSLEIPRIRRHYFRLIFIYHGGTSVCFPRHLHHYRYLHLARHLRQIPLIVDFCRGCLSGQAIYICIYGYIHIYLYVNLITFLGYRQPQVLEIYPTCNHVTVP